jgi:hypothetical protein
MSLPNLKRVISTLVFRANAGSPECAVEKHIGFHKPCGLYSEPRYTEIGYGMQICDTIPTLNFAAHLDRVLLLRKESCKCE